jgi:amino acid adenylation domain-containing protein
MAVDGNRAQPAGVRVLPASPAQRGLYFLERLAPGSGATNVIGLLSIDGELDLARLRLALDRVAARHDALRTTLTEADGEIVQRVWPGWYPRAYEFVQLIADDPVTEAFRQAARGFDTEHGPLWRVAAVRTSAAATWQAISFAFHHAIVDEQSSVIFGRELAACYADPDIPLDVPAAQYGDFLANLTDARDVPRWADKLAGVQPLRLPGRQADPGPASAGPGATDQVSPFAAGQVPLDVSAELHGQVAAARTRHGLSPYMIFLAALSAAVHRLSGTSDFVIGTPMSLRPDSAADVIGNFSNTALLHFRLGPDTTVRELLRGARAAVFDALEYQRAPFERVVAALRPEREGNTVPLVHVALVYNRETFGSTWAFAGAGVCPVPFPWEVTDFDITVDLIKGTGQELTGDVTYSSLRFDPLAMTSLADAIGVIMRQLVHADDSLRLRHLELMGEQARALLLRQAAAPPQWAAPAGGWPATVVHLLDAAAGANPDGIAVDACDGQLSFAALCSWSRAIAATLAARSMQQQVVGVRMSRRLALAAAVFGAWRSRNAILLLDPADPPGRLATLLTEAGVTSVLVEPDSPPTVRDLPGAMAIEAPADLEPPSDPEPALAGPAGTDTAYVMFTSGSAGVPKGVIVEHRSLAAHAVGQLALLLAQGTEGQPHRVGGTSAVSFDTFINHVTAIALGHTLVLLDDTERLDIPRVVSRNDDQATAISFLDVTPRHLELMIEAGLLSRRYPPRVLICGGEAVPPRLWDALRRCGIAAFNTYGPTECTIDCMIADIRAHDRPTIGRPYGAALIYVADTTGALLPAGFDGEIRVGGTDVARGYLGRPDLTAAVFLPDPYRRVPGARIYLTGDVGRLDGDGQIEYLGRADGQLKVRGVRVEPGEIETVIGAHPGARDCAVVSPNGTSLVAFVVAAQEARRNGDLAAELRAHAARYLPATLVPDRVVLIDDLPLTRHGKTDRKRLTGLRPEPPEPGGIRPMTPAEQPIAQVAAEVLGLPAIHADDDFFRLGGDSIRALTLIVRLRERLGMHMDLARFMRSPTVAAIAAAERAGNGYRRHAPHLVDITADGTAQLTPDKIAGSRPSPLYLLVPPIGGSVLPLRRIAELLASHRHVAAIEWPSPSDAAGTLPDFVTWPAEQLAGWLPGRQAEQVVVVGWSLGGIIGHAVAGRLEQSGVPVGRIVLLDSRLPTDAERGELMAITRKLATLAERLPGSATVTGVIDELDLAANLAALGVTVTALAGDDGDVIAQMAGGWKDVLALVAQYVPARLRCAASLLHCESAPAAAAGATDGWREVCGELSVGSVAADHFSMLRSPAAEHVVEWVLAQSEQDVCHAP